MRVRPHSGPSPAYRRTLDLFLRIRREQWLREHGLRVAESPTKPGQLVVVAELEDRVPKFYTLPP